MLSPTQLQDEIVRLQIRVSELERENTELRNGPQPTSPRFDTLPQVTMPPPSLPPPPPPPLMNRALKPLRKPKGKMRGLFWLKLRRPTGQNLQHSLWDQVQALPASLYLDDQLCLPLEEAYSALERKASASKTRTSREPRYIEVLDSKRATNLSIQHNGLPDHWFSAVEQLSLDALSEEQVEQLKLAVPSKEEFSEIETAQAAWPGKPLRDAEQFLLQLGATSWIQERLTCWSFALRAPSLTEAIRTRTDLLRAAIFELRLEPNICPLAHLLLTTGNFLNHGTARGDAYGFSYTLLAGLADTKSNGRDSNLLSFLARQAQQRGLIASNLSGSIELLNAAGKFMLSEVESNLAELDSFYATCLRMVQHIASRDPDNLVVAKFQSIVTTFSEKLQALRNDVRSCHDDFNELLGWLGLTVAEMPTVSSADFFQLWGKFFAALSGGK